MGYVPGVSGLVVIIEGELFYSLACGLIWFY